MRVFFVPILRFTLDFVLRSELVWTKIDETRFRAANKQGLEIVIVIVSNIRVNVGMA